MERRITKKVKVGNIFIGGLERISVQSMLSRRSDDIAANVLQAVELEAAGCDIIRLAVPDLAAVKTLAAVKESVTIPVVADIHFDYKIALECASAGVDKIRINPGNIGSDSRVYEVVKACATKNIPIRIGVNSGSLEKHILARFGGVTAEALVESALYHACLLEKFDFAEIVLSLKASNTKTMFEAYRLASAKTNYPLHLGVTEAGTERMGLIKSSAAIGGLLLSGIGDTIRISLTDEPIKEVYAGIDLLKSVGERTDGVTFISCPTCGRTKIDIIKLAKQAEELLKDCKKPIKVAIMGCVVNGPGEAKDADIGIAGGDGCGLIFKNGEILRKVPENELLRELLKEINEM